jgi:hypothetical protein
MSPVNELLMDSRHSKDNDIMDGLVKLVTVSQTLFGEASVGF